MIVAIDPGANGGIAIMTNSGNVVVEKLRSESLKAMLYQFGTFTGNDTIALEDVGFHVKGNNAQASATFAKHVGHLEMALAANWLEPVYVKPREWMKTLGPLPKDKSERKNEIKRLMQERYPHIKVTLWSSDSLGILTWAFERKMK